VLLARVCMDGAPHAASGPLSLRREAPTLFVLQEDAGVIVRWTKAMNSDSAGKGCTNMVAASGWGVLGAVQP